LETHALRVKVTALKGAIAWSRNERPGGGKSLSLSIIMRIETDDDQLSKGQMTWGNSRVKWHS
jgi:hypothetical protein